MDDTTSNATTASPRLHVPPPRAVSAPPRGIVLLSGGLDSATVLAYARREGFVPLAMTFRYGQRHSVEIDASRRVAAAGGVSQHVVVDIDLRQWGGSALTAELPVPKDRDMDLPGSEIPVTYVPARNTIFLSFALAWAEVNDVQDIFVGVNALDYSGYPDCRPAYIAAFEAMANLATRAGVEGTRRLRIHAPLQHYTKTQIIALGLSLGVDYSLTISCYDPSQNGISCGRCDACQLRLRGFASVGTPDPVRYALSSRHATQHAPPD